MRYIYICSAGHSGSTLLDLMMGSHSNVESMGEISHLSKNIALNTQCACGLPVRDCKTWRAVFTLVEKHTGKSLTQSPYSLLMGYPKAKVVIDKNHQNALYLLKREFFLALRYLQLRYNFKLLSPFTNTLEIALKNNFLIAESLCHVCKKELVVDSSKDYVKAVGLYLQRPELVRLVVLTRDGRGVLHSNLKRKFSINSSIKGWKNYYSRAISLIDKHVNKKHILTVKYEELVKHPESVLKEICEFTGIKFQSQMLDFSSHTHHIANGNDMRFSNDSTIKIDDEWQSKLAPDVIKTFENMGGSLNKKLGYQ